MGLAGTAKAVAVGRAGGLGIEQPHDLLDESPMLAPGLRNRFDAVPTEDTEDWWTTVLGAKDLRLALDVADGQGHDLVVSETARNLYE